MTFTYPAVSHVFQGPGFSGFRFFRVQVFRVRVQGPGPGSRVLVQGPGPGFRSSPLNSVCDSLSFTPLECYENSLNIYFSWKVFFVMIFFAQELSNGILFSKSSILKNPIEMWHSKNMKTIQKQERASSEQKSDVFHKKWSIELWTILMFELLLCCHTTAWCMEET